MRKLDDKKSLNATMPGQHAAKGFNIKKSLLAIAGLLLVACTQAQFVVTPSSSAQALATSLAGSGVTITNPTRTGDVNMSGTFTNSGTNLGLSAGVILSTGKVINVPQAANGFASNSFSGNGDPQLQTLTGGYIYDKSVLEFDVIPQGNILSFNYIFASEEYPEWVCSQFNDVFGFFISGPNPNGGANYSSVNIAKVPNSNLPVAINTINPGVSGQYGTASNCQSLSYSSLFRNNLTPTVNPDIVYDGMTQILTAVVSVVPCQTYHLKLAVADVGDRIFDSGVMLQANSITSTPITITSQSQLDSYGYTSAYEGCVSGKFTFSIPTPQPADITAAIQIGGTATNGVDYPTIPNFITIPAGQVSTDLVILPTQDNIAEPAESIVISTIDPCSNGTLSSATMMIQEDVEPTISSSAPAVCSGQTSQLNATGGVAYTWTPIAGLNDATIANPIASPNATTTYTAHISWGSCNKELTTTITLGGPSVSLTASPAPVICSGGNVQIYATTNNGNYTYNWSNGSHASSISVSSAGNYDVTISDNSGCNSVATTTISASSINLSGTTTNTGCGGANTGSIDLSVAGNGSAYTYSWSNTATTEDISNLTGGAYTVTVTNNAGCTATQTFNILQTNSNMQATAAVTNTGCNAGSNGAITLSVTNGVAPYSYVWDNNANGATVTGLAAGTYTATITDAGGCSLVKSATVAQPSALSAGTSTASAGCTPNGTASVSVSGGTSAYSYVWSNGSQTRNINGLQAGTYTVTITDANGCSITKDAVVAQAPVANLSIATTPSGCGVANGSATASVANGASPYTFNWSANSNVHTAAISGLPIGSVNATVTDANGCVATASATVQSANGANADFTFSGTYCEPVAVVNFTHAGSAGVTAHSWNFGSNNVTSNAASPSFAYTTAGTYNVMHAVQSGGCVDTVYKTITIQAKPVLNPTVTNVSCNGGNTGSIALNTAGGASPYTYAWADGANTANRAAIAEGTYAVTVTGSNGCVANYTTTLTRSSAVTLTETHNDITCNAANNASINVNVSGGAAPYFYNWNNGSIAQNLTMVAAGTYTVTAADANNCSASITINIIEPAKLQAALMVENPVCAGTNNGTIDVNVSGGTPPMTYRWTNGSNAQSRTNLGAGTYAVMVNDANGCTATQSATVTEPNEIVLKESHVNPTCNGYANGSINITATGGSGNFIYNWNNQQTANTATNLTAGQYAVTVTDAKGCTSVLDHIVITHPAALIVDANITNAACGVTNGGAVDVTVNGGSSPYLYNWSNSATTEDITSVSGGSYMLTVTDANGCIKVSNQTVQSSGSLVVTAVANQLPCEIQKGVINLSVSNGMAPYSFEWNNGETTNDLNNVLPGTYSVTIKDAANCTFDTSLTIINNNQFTVQATVNGVTEAGQNAELNAVSNGSALVTYQWTPSATLPCTTCDHVVVRPSETTTYTVVATDTNGCTAHDTVTVEVNNETNIFIPNAFTPNGDGNNDVLQIYGDLNSIKYLQLLVFDRWGEKVYETNDVNFQWDGVYKGKKLDPSVYLYVMKVVHYDGTTNRTFKGSITLL